MRLFVNKPNESWCVDTMHDLPWEPSTGIPGEYSIILGCEEATLEEAIAFGIPRHVAEKCFRFLWQNAEKTEMIVQR